MHNEVYADALSEITVTGPIVRLDLVSLAPGAQGANAAATSVLRQRIIMPVAAFAHAVGLMRRALDGLIEAGTVPSDADDPLVLSARPEPPPEPNRSPNFQL